MRLILIPVCAVKLPCRAARRSGGGGRVNVQLGGGGHCRWRRRRRSTGRSGLSCSWFCEPWCVGGVAILSIKVRSYQIARIHCIIVEVFSSRRFRMRCSSVPIASATSRTSCKTSVSLIAAHVSSRDAPASQLPLPSRIGLVILFLDFLSHNVMPRCRAAGNRSPGGVLPALEPARCSRRSIARWVRAAPLARNAEGAHGTPMGARLANGKGPDMPGAFPLPVQGRSARC